MGIGEETIVRNLAWFRYNLRLFLRFSEQAARACGVTPQQHQLMLGIAGFAEGGSATVSELAEFLQERNNSVVGLVERAARCGLVRRDAGSEDRRQVVVSLTARGEEILARLSVLHHDEVARIRSGFLSPHKRKRRAAGRHAERERSIRS
ncbi:MAG TPA: MarR family transcriptional regulator [Acidobacteriaceae bacterium]|jgi:DNA-binding MarR family transcriptional regulator|nr:MarR family transcriptional regulator [Acidobacteriaceae bacterium]